MPATLRSIVILFKLGIGATVAAAAVAGMLPASVALR